MKLTKECKKKPNEFYIIKNFFLILVFLFSSIYNFSQQNRSVYKVRLNDKERLEKVQQFFRKKNRILENHEMDSIGKIICEIYKKNEKLDTSVFKIALKISHQLIKERKWEKGYIFLFNLVGELQNDEVINEVGRFDVLYNFIVLQSSSGKIYSSEKNSRKLYYITDWEKINSDRKVNLLYYLAMLNQVMNNYQKALSFYQSVLEIKANENNYDSVFQAKVHHNLALVYLNSSNFENALININKAQSLSKSFPGVSKARLFMNKGRILEKLNKVDLSIKYFEYVKKLIGKYNLFDQEINFFNQFYLSNLLLRNKNFTRSREELEIATNFLIGNRFPPYVQSLPYYGLSKLSLSEGKIEEALMNSYKALEVYFPDNQDLTTRISLRDINNISSKEDFLLCLIHHAHILGNFQSKNRQDDYLKLSLETYQLAQHLVDTVRLGILAEGDKLFWMADQNAFYSSAIDCAFRLYNWTKDEQYLEVAFQFAEKGKANVLYEHIQSQEALTYSQVDSNSISLLQNISEEITYHERQLFEKGSEIDSISKQGLKNTLFILKERKDSLKREIEAQNPAYYKLSYDLSVSSLSEVQQTLKPDQVFLSYFLRDTTLFVFYISTDSVKLYKWKKERDLGRSIKEFRETISLWPVTRDYGKKDTLRRVRERRYAKLGYSLYQQLFAPIISRLPLGQRLVIVPHGELYYLPFDALLTDSVENIGGYSRYPYLFQKHSLSINYSATLWKEMHRPKKRKKLQPLLGMALTFSEGPEQALDRSSSVKDTLPQIPFSKTEFEGLRERVGGRLFLDTAATRKRFWEEAPKHRIIHLSTHAWLNEENSDFSFIALAPEDSGTNHHKVYVKELYNLDLEADLVVLSACETGLGKLYQGEGMLSVARGFSYAGARSIVNTLWSVNDKATASFNFGIL